jgi:hypothetical protein
MGPVASTLHGRGVMAWIDLLSRAGRALSDRVGGIPNHLLVERITA